jgi:hypothetical protein
MIINMRKPINTLREKINAELFDRYATPDSRELSAYFRQKRQEESHIFAVHLGDYHPLSLLAGAVVFAEIYAPKSAEAAGLVEMAKKYTTGFPIADTLIGAVLGIVCLAVLARASALLLSAFKLGTAANGVKMVGEMGVVGIVLGTLTVVVKQFVSLLYS